MNEQQKQNNSVEYKSEILFLYESVYSVPNGDPFTGEQRYDEETKKILVSDVRIKRFIRDYLEENGEDIYVSDKTGAGKTTSAGAIKNLYNRFKKKNEEIKDVEKILKKCIDVRLFGGISTLKGADAKIDDNTSLENTHVQYTGPVQFALLSPSLNAVNLRIHQNTSHFLSGEGKGQGAIGTTTIVPYALVQIHGWLNPKVAENTGLTEDDVKKMLKALWYGTSGDGSSHSRSKAGQNSILLLNIIYNEPQNKLYGIDKLIRLTNKNGKKDEELRGMDDFEFDFAELVKVASSEKIKEIEYYTEINDLSNKLRQEEFKKIEFSNK